MLDGFFKVRPNRIIVRYYFTDFNQSVTINSPCHSFCIAFWMNIEPTFVILFIYYQEVLFSHGISDSNGGYCFRRVRVSEQGSTIFCKVGFDLEIVY